MEADCGMIGPDGKSSDPLHCARDNTPVDDEYPRCLHPSSVCDFRELCNVMDAIRRKHRAEGSTGKDAS